jgi:hypothetical protein
MAEPRVLTPQLAVSLIWTIADSIEAINDAVMFHGWAKPSEDDDSPFWDVPHRLSGVIEDLREITIDCFPGAEPDKPLKAEAI